MAAPNGEMALAGTPMYFAPEIAARIFDEACEVPLTDKADVFALALSLLHSIEEPDLSELDGVEVDAFLKRRAEASPSGPRDKRLKRLREPFSRWLAPHPSERPTAGQLADEIAQLGGTGRRTVQAPAGLRGAVVGLAMTALVVGSATLVDAPSRPIQLIQSEDGTVVHPTRPPNESEREAILRHRLEQERLRSQQLEEELQRFRQRELGVQPPEGASSEPVAERPNGEAPSAPPAPASE